MKPILVIAMIVVAATAAVGVAYYRSVIAGPPQQPRQPSTGSLWDFQTTTLVGEPVDLAAYRGQVALVVNVASKCGFTPQYEGLQTLYDQFQSAGFVILGFPSNDFRHQEPGTPAEIQKFCRLNYGITFPMFGKTHVKGDGQDPIYRFLTSGGLKEPTWNFTKYLVGRDGKVIARFAPKTVPDDSTLLVAIDRALAQP